MNQTTIKKSNYKLNELDIDLRELFKALFQYKWSILLTSFSILLVAGFFLYFKTSIYSSYAIIEVKSDKKQGMDKGDFLGSAFSGLGKEKVDKEIEILKTFHTNDYALNRVNFQTQYFLDEGLKKVEIYDNIPIEVKNVTISDQDIIGRIVKLIPVKDGYHLQVKNSLKNKLLHLLFNKDIIKLDNQKVHHYGSGVKTDYFELTIEKNTTIKQPLYFVLKGDNRQIYQTIIENLQVTQLNPSAPLIEISYKDSIPKRANVYVDVLIESFILQSVAEKSRQTDRIINFIRTGEIDG